MSIEVIIRLIVSALVVIGMAWVGIRQKTIRRVLVWALSVALVSSLLFSVPALWPTEFVANEFSRTGNTNLYVTWNIKYFFIDFIPTAINLGIIILGASVTAWLVRVRFGKPMWISILSGTITALVLLIPAIAAGIAVLTIIIPGSWP